MSLIIAALLGLLQGVTEFVPVSSSGHLLAARLLFGISDASGTFFDAFLHLGTLTAVLIYYWRTWAGIMRGLFFRDAEGMDKQELVAKLLIATIPAGLAGYFLQDVVAEYFRSAQALAIGLLITAAVLWFFDRLAIRREVPESAGEPARASFMDAWVIGLMQVVALVPGVSRSGMTIAAGRLRGLSRHQATHFSFLLSAPIIAGAGLNGLSNLVSSGGFGLPELAVGFTLACASGLAAIHLLLKWIEKMSFTPFVLYLAVLAGVVAIYG